ncbi:2-oxoglutarate dehydrogenase complex dihydrolipoyllysine-residue succinyltransferase [Tanticharoenia sakaeratensis]|uniref:Dihydrolipoyllysine-residue succinyltransferase component of 2-oxoglutarate dehydrogenase complex n=1 Tax=Tanticharoenia sakaeratensis NBRC 103193 TaxID=1231623 RepID=A0A0D6MMT7_9PROT|nr:2-oxoglutarate dehydrogenase complex dihydrolipoyllysine-residue succinyltransferase [Tanticharoenia sakaeratensis]GAN54997.1 2-oxoglutarate dehydrogenase E2 component [Tanticharoenia sakaeratensis NBRC 103193]GBQ20424.1 2-oxoglutarate dehydrogenase E2 component [Tanticharoenia sakaeratensis NBRC 103193]
MTAEIRVPVLGESVSSAVVARWLKQPGDPVKADDPVVELETDKVSVEVPATGTGTMGPHAVSEGDEVAVGALLARIDGSATTSEQAAPSAPVSPAPPPPAPDTEPDPAKPGAAQAPMPAAARAMEELDIAPAEIGTGSGRDGRITKGDVIAFTARQGEAKAEPAKPAAEAVKPSEAAAPTAPAQPTEARRTAPPRSHGPLSGHADPRETRVRMTRLRQTIARRLKEAQATAAILTTVNEIDMSAARAMRAEYREAFEKAHGVRLGFMSFFARACAVALREFPAINAEIDGEDIVYREFVNLGIAISSPRGLVVPVLRDAGTMEFAEIERRIAEYGKRARDGSLALDELTGGTFSITNGGVFGSLLSTPILNAPQSGILGMHAIQDRPVAINGQVVIRPMMYVALSYDHRIVDGREAVSFLVRVKQLVEDPRRLILGV